MMAFAARAWGMPPFAQAYAVDCSVCHTEVPGLNAHGRYVQRSGYDALDHKALQRSLPVWVGVNPSYDSRNDALKLQGGNVAIHAIGVLGNWSYHVQQWIWQANAPGGLDTAWIAYNALFQRRGHLFIGKIESPAPSPFSQWFDQSSFSLASMSVGEHAYQLDANRWGVKFSYVRGSFDGEVSWLGSGMDLGGTSDFKNDTDKTFQWKIAYADAERPFEIGAFGSRGSFPLPEGGTDQYWSSAFYLQRDPKWGVPGSLIIYQSTFDANPGAGAAAAAGTAATIELYDTFLRGRLLFAARKEFTNDGLGTQSQSGNADIEYHLARFVHVYFEMYLTQHNKPGYRYMLWWTTPLESTRPM
jgi:hypothetical protein